MQETALEHNVYEIPIEDYEEDMNTESSKDKNKKT